MPRYLIGVKFTESVLEYDVPHGSVLRPVFLFLYINDLTQLNISDKFTLFADYSSNLFQIKNYLELSKQVSLDMHRLKECCDIFSIRKNNIVFFNGELNNAFLENEAN